jgi:hypothetical protein
MPSYLMDASLGVDVGGSFPFIFPYYFGPNASISLDANAQATQAVTATPTDAVTLYGYISATEAITASFTEILKLSGLINAPNAITVIEAAVASSEDIDAPLGVTAGQAASMSVAYQIDAHLSVTADNTASGGLPQSCDVDLGVTGGITAAFKASFKALSSQLITATVSPAVKFHGLAKTSRAITVAAPTRFRQDWTADASLVVGCEQGFPYTFPFTFGTTNNSLTLGHVANTALTVTATDTASGTRGAVAHASQLIAVTTSVALLLGHENFANVTLGITASTIATMTRGRPLNAAQAIDATPSGHVQWKGHFQSELAASTPSQADVLFGASVDTVLDLNSGTQTSLSMDAILRSSLRTQVAIIERFVRDRNAAANLPISVNASGSLNHDVVVDAFLSVRATTEANTPLATGFWPFFLA